MLTPFEELEVHLEHVAALFEDAFEDAETDVIFDAIDSGRGRVTVESIDLDTFLLHYEY